MNVQQSVNNSDRQHTIWCILTGVIKYKEIVLSLGQLIKDLPFSLVPYPVAVWLGSD